MSSITKQTQISAFYKGSCFPLGITDKEQIYDLTLHVKKKIKEAIANGVTKEEMISRLKEQLDGVKKLLPEICTALNKHAGLKLPRRCCYQSLDDKNVFYAMKIADIWYNNIVWLLELGAIKNDDNNGFLYEEKYKH